MYYLKVFPFYSILITIQSWVVIFFFGYGTFTETAVKAKMIPLTCTWQGFFFSLGTGLQGTSVIVLSFLWKSHCFEKVCHSSKIHQENEILQNTFQESPPPFQVSGADVEVSEKGFVFLMFFPIATAHVLRAAGSSCMVHVYL